jgi:GGDEF domain-containing protein
MERRLADALGAFNCRRTTSFELSFSIGTSVLVPPASPTLAELIARADEALYRSKRTAGRRVAAWPTAVRPIAAA